MDAATFEGEFGPEPVFDESPPREDSPVWLRQEYIALTESFDAMHARWRQLRAKWVAPE